MLLSLAGLGISAYLTAAHYASHVVLACPDTGTINCQEVTTSAQSVIAGIPVAVLGVAFYAAMLLLNLPASWRRSHPALRWSRIGLAAVGVTFALYLIYLELFTIHAICLWCTGAHLLAFLLLLTVLSADSLARTGRNRDEYFPTGRRRVRRTSVPLN